MSYNAEGWIGVDFDGTLATYHGWKGLTTFGEPIKPMVDRVRMWIEQGKDVRIFTARLNIEDNILIQTELTLALQEWCIRHIGKALPVTCIKDLHMLELYDDRAIQVERNTGRLVGYSTRE